MLLTLENVVFFGETVSVYKNTLETAR